MAWHAPWMIWLAQSAFVGLVLLAAGCLGVLLCRQPVRRLRLMEITLVACLLAPLLSLCPAVPRWSLGWFESPSEGHAQLNGQHTETTGQALDQSTALTALPDPVPSRPAAVAEVVARKSQIVLPQLAGASARDVFSPVNGPTPERLRAASFLPITLVPYLLGAAYVIGTALFLLRWLIGWVELV